MNRPPPPQPPQPPIPPRPAANDSDQGRMLAHLLTANVNAVATGIDLESHRFWTEQLATEKYADPKKLTRHGFKVYSQSDEDGIIQEIFRRIGETDRRFIEFGVETGVECNTVKLLVGGWSGLWLEGKAANITRIRETLGAFVSSGKLTAKEAFVTAENINELITGAGLTGEIDFLCVDIDYNDYWVWRAIDAVNPRVVAIEYNATLAPPLSAVVPYEPTRSWDGSSFFGASLEALVRLGKKKGYRLVGCSFSGVNAFFVREDLCADKFFEPATAEALFEPPRYFLRFPGGHRNRPGPFVNV